jgi:hypothetical protein
MSEDVNRIGYWLWRGFFEAHGLPVSERASPAGWRALLVIVALAGLVPVEQPVVVMLGMMRFATSSCGTPSASRNSFPLPMKRESWPLCSIPCPARTRRVGWESGPCVVATLFIVSEA